MSVVQLLLSLQSALLAQARQPSFGSQIGVPAAQLVLSAVFEQVPLLHVSLVQAMPSLQSVSAQQPLQPESQHLVPAAQPANEHLPATQDGED